MAIRNEILRRRIARVTMLAASEGDRLGPGLAAGSPDGRPAYRFRRRGLCGRGGDDSRDDRRCVIDGRRLNAQRTRRRARSKRRAGARPGKAPMSTDAETPRPAPLACLSAACVFGPSPAPVPALAGDPASIPSVLIGQSAPPLDLPGLDGAAGLTDADLRRVMSAWSTFRLVVPALPLRARISDGSRRRPSAEGQGRRDLRRRAKGLGRKYPPLPRRKGRTLRQGRPRRDGGAGIEWGVYGVPETFIVKGDGSIAFKLVGPMNAETLESEIKPQIMRAMNQAHRLRRELPLRGVVQVLAYERPSSDGLW